MADILDRLQASKDKGKLFELVLQAGLKDRKRPVRTVFLRQSKLVILEEWEVREARKF